MTTETRRICEMCHGTGEVTRAVRYGPDPADVEMESEPCPACLAREQEEDYYYGP